MARTIRLFSVLILGCTLLGCPRGGDPGMRPDKKIPGERLLSLELPRVFHRENVDIALMEHATDSLRIRLTAGDPDTAENLTAVLALPEDAEPKVHFESGVPADSTAGTVLKAQDVSDVDLSDRFNVRLEAKLRGTCLYGLHVGNMGMILSDPVAESATQAKTRVPLRSMDLRITWNPSPPSGEPPEVVYSRGAVGRILDRLVLNYPWYLRDVEAPDWPPPPPSEESWLPIDNAEDVLRSLKDGLHPCVRLSAREEGVYAVAGQHLKTLGYRLDDIKIPSLRLFRNRREVPLHILSGHGGSLRPEDRICFANPKKNPDSRAPNVYWMTWGVGEGLRYRRLEAPKLNGQRAEFAARWTIRRMLMPIGGANPRYIWDQIGPGRRTSLRFHLPGVISHSQKDYEFQVGLNSQRLPFLPRTEAFLNGQPVEITHSLGAEGVLLEFKANPGWLLMGENLLEIEPDKTGEHGIAAGILFLAVNGFRELNGRDAPCVLHGRELRRAPPNGMIRTKGWRATQTVLAFDPGETCVWVRDPLGKKPEKVRTEAWPSPLRIRQGPRSREIRTQKEELKVPPDAPLVLVRFNGQYPEPMDIQSFFTRENPADAARLLDYLHGIRRGETLVAMADDRVPDLIDPECRSFFEWLGVGSLASQQGVPSACVTAIGILGGHGEVASGAPAATLFLGESRDTEAAFPVSSATDSSLYVTADEALQTPEKIVPLRSPGLRDPDHSADMIVIAPQEFMGSLEPWVEYREGQGYRLFVADIEQVYNEFGAGVVSATSINRFLRQAVASWKEPVPQYVVLVGDANEDYYDQQGYGTPNIIPCPRDPSNMYATDDILLRFGEKGNLPQFVSGRFPASRPEQVSDMVQKVLDYEQRPELGPWRSRILAIYDYGSAGFYDEFRDEELPEGVRPCPYFATNVPVEPYPTIMAVRRNAKNSPQAATELTEMITDGHAIIQYMGHGGGIVWGRTALLRVGDRSGADSNRFENGPKLPLVHSFSCLVGIPDYSAPIGRSSLCEWFFARPGGGAVGSFGPSWKGWASNLAYLSKRINHYLLRPEPQPVGEAYVYAKADTLFRFQDDPVQDDYIYFGDPLLRFSLPPNIVDVTVEVTTELQVARIRGTVEKDPSGLVQLTLHSKDDAALWQEKEIPVDRGRFEATIPLNGLPPEPLKGIYAAFWSPEDSSEGVGYCPFPVERIYSDIREATGMPLIEAASIPPQKIFPGCSVAMDLTLYNPSSHGWRNLCLVSMVRTEKQETERKRQLRGHHPSLPLTDFSLLEGERRPIRVHTSSGLEENQGTHFVRILLQHGVEILDSTTVQFLPLKPPDLSVHPSDFRVVGLFNPFYHRVRVEGAVRNLGESMATYVKVRFREDGEPLRPTLWFPRIAPGGLVRFSQILPVSTLTPVITVEVDPFNEFDEISEGNNQFTEEVGIDSPHM